MIIFVIMNKDTVDPNTSSNNVNNSTSIKSSHSISGRTKMFILPPNLLQNLCISDSITKDTGMSSTLKFIKKDNPITTVRLQEHKNDKNSNGVANPTNSNIVIRPTTATEVNTNNLVKGTDNESLIKVTKVSEGDATHVEKKKNSLHTNIRKQKNNTKVGSSANWSGNRNTSQKAECAVKKIDNKKMTSNDLPKPRKANVEPVQSSSKKYVRWNLEKQKKAECKYETAGNMLGRSKRVRKQTKFDDYITSYNEELCNKNNTNLKKNVNDKKRNSTVLNKDESGVIGSEDLMSSTSQTNDLKYVKCKKQELKKKNNENNISTCDIHTSITPALTKNSLPLNSNTLPKKDSGIEINDKKLYTKNLQNCKNVKINTTLKNVKNNITLNDNGGNEVCTRSINTSVLKKITIKVNDSRSHSRLRRIKRLHDDKSSAKETWSNLTSTALSTVLNDKNLQENAHNFNKSEKLKNVDASQKMNDTSITETVIYSKEHNEKSYNINNHNGSKDASSTEPNIPNLISVKKKGRPVGTSAGVDTGIRRGAGRGKGRGRDKGRGRGGAGGGGRGRGRGRGRGIETYNSTLDTENAPKSTGPITGDKTKEENADKIGAIEHTENVDVVICAKCERDVPKKQWSSHNISTHNNMSWIKGDEPMNFESDMKLWRKVLSVALKKKRGHLSCEQCNSVKRSVNGFISHMQFCGKSDDEKQALMASCPICGAIMMPSSMEIHERTHRQSEQSKIKELQFSTNTIERVKRKAAEKAQTKILEFTELVKDSSLPSGKKLKLEPSLLRSIIKTPNNKRTIPAVWKGIWKKELLSEGTITCRQLGCTYTSTSFEDMCQHFSKCNYIPQECYVCKICKFSSISSEEMMTHVAEEHTTLCGIDQGSDFEEENYSSDEKSTYTMRFLDKDQICKIGWSEPYFPAVQWTMEFEQNNYELYLFHDYLPNEFTLLKNSEANKYLPELEYSMRTTKESTPGTNNTEIPWKQWKRFEGGLDEGTPTFFTGGPVWALAWLPIPSPIYTKEPFQYVAISTHPTMESEYTVGKSYAGRNMIQIWNVGPLDHEIDSRRESPALSYSIVHNNGTIWCLECCPSGCYDDDILNNSKKENKLQSSLKRMGMLAAACSDGNVYIYSLPFPEELSFEKAVDNDWPIYCTDPIITLVVNISLHDNKDIDWQCTKLSWTKEKRHNIIAAGFSNGYIALWDLTYKSPLSIQKKQNTYFINAFQHFHAHGNAVTMVALVPYGGGRFLASGSVDKTYRFWDLESISTPNSCMPKGVIVNGAWMTHWPCAVLCFDDALGYKHTNTYLVSLREHEFKYFPLLATNSPTYGLAVSDYANSIAHGSLAGEVLTVFAYELVHGRDIEKILHKKRKLSSFIRIIDFWKTESNREMDERDKNSKEYHYMPETYNECQDRFGIIFCDNLKDVERYMQHERLGVEKLTPVPIEEYPFMSANRISWNPNTWSYLWMVVGYQNGLVRLLNFRYMSMAHDFNALLPQHVNFMLNKAKIATEKHY